MATVIRRKYALAELPSLLERLASEPVSPEEIERRRRLSEEVDRIREEMPPIPFPIENWIREVRGEKLAE